LAPVAGSIRSSLRLAFLLKLCFKRRIGRKHNLIIKFFVADSSGDPGVIATNRIEDCTNICSRRNSGSHFVYNKLRVMGQAHGQRHCSSTSS
jgi:hypothetical protein